MLVLKGGIVKAVKDSVSANDSEQILYLTPNRSSQQTHSDRAIANKRKLRNKKFTMLKNPPYYCKKFAIALLKYQNGTLNYATFLRMICNSWRCPTCAPIKARSVGELIRGVIILNGMKYFITLTLDPKVIPEKYRGRTQKYITYLFNTLRTNISRMVKGKDIFKYVWVIEFQKNGNAHIHMAINTRLDITKVREIWTRIGGGVQMRVEPIQDLISMSGYLSKYILKSVTNIQGSNFYHFEKRYGISQSCIRPSKTAKPFHPELSDMQKQLLLHKQGNSWVYNTLLRGDFVDGEEISAPEIPV